MYKGSLSALREIRILLQGALSGLHRMEAGGSGSGEGGLEASYDMEMAEIGQRVQKIMFFFFSSV